MKIVPDLWLSLAFLSKGRLLACPRSKGKGLRPRAVAEAEGLKHTPVLLSLSIESKAEVDSYVKKALDNGGKLLPVDEISGAKGMYFRDVEDLDGHILEFGYIELPAK